MPRLIWYFDLISPFAALAVPEIAAFDNGGNMEYRPVLFAGLLKAWGHLGPAEIPAKRIQMYRQALWLARERGIAFRSPPAHPFNPLMLLRLLCAKQLTHTDVAAAFRLVWGEGHDPQAQETGQLLADALGIPIEAASDPEVKDTLRQNTDAAIAAGIYGIPTLQIDAELFWGLDAMPMARAYLDDPAFREDNEWLRVSNLPMATERRR